jgi:hypothetical protein
MKILPKKKPDFPVYLWRKSPEAKPRNAGSIALFPLIIGHFPSR